ncbi:MAG: ATP synthase F1 subunit delta [Candidatus Omnitrophica bacterium]|nr:ATP synthase F1 subunit delta [Candidatus Omnitrophota bacterium]
MSRDPLVSSNYAKALLHVVQKSGAGLTDAQEEARQLRKLIAAEPRLRIFLEGPQFREEDKERVVANVFRGQLSEVFFQFLLLVLRRDRIEHLFDILDVFDYLVELEEGLTPGTVTTAVDLSEEERERMQKSLESSRGLKFDLRFKVDPDLIGGVKVQYKDILIDTTIQTHLGDLRQRLLKTRLAI